MSPRFEDYNEMISRNESTFINIEPSGIFGEKENSARCEDRYLICARQVVTRVQ